MDKLRAMQSFVAIADAGTLTAAARAQNTSLPAVVRLLAALEEDLGVRLFQRSTRRVTLTDAGRRYLDHCRALIEQMHDAEAELHAEQSEPRGNLSVTAPVLFGLRHVGPGILGFLSCYPRVNVRVLYLDRVVNLIEEGIDVGVRIGHLQDSALIAQHVGSMRRLTVAAPSYLERHGEPAHPRDLQAHNCVRHWRDGPSNWTFHERGRSFVVPVRGNVVTNQTVASVDACVAGVGLGNFFAYQVAPALASGALRVVLARYESEPVPIHIVYPEARLLPARARLFIAAMKQHLEREQRTWEPAGSAPRASAVGPAQRRRARTKARR